MRVKAMTDPTNPDAEAPKIRAYLGNRYAGQWALSDDRLAIGTQHPSTQDLQFVAASGPNGFCIELINTKYNETELKAFASTLRAALSEQDSRAYAAAAFWLDCSQNRIEASFRTASVAVQRALRNAVPADALVIRIDPTADSRLRAEGQGRMTG